MCMKKSLLLGLAVAACFGSAMADAKTPTIYPDASFQRISANGRYIVSEVYGTVRIYDLVEGTYQEFTEDENYIYYYSLGLGNCITADGSILLGSTKNDCDAAYLQNGEWHHVPVLSEENTNLTNGITPDGSRICGSVGLTAISLEEVTMLAPAYWDRKADGTGYGECHVLPYPKQDLFGDKPQYITGISISSDGKTIVGQMVFSSDMMTIPVIYKEDDKGEWSYSLPTKDLFNPNKLEPVENPGDGPASPNYEDYMTEEEIAAYNAAINKFYEDNDWSAPYPEYTDFMTDEEKAAYEAAYAQYETANEEWDAKFNAYMEYMTEVMNASPNFLFNNVLISTDDKYIVCTLEREDPNSDPFSWFPSRLYTPCTINIETGEFKIHPIETTCLASGVADNGIIYGYNGQNKTPMTGYVLQGDSYQTLQEYITTANPAYGEWILKNMTHEVIVDYDEQWNEITEECVFTGMPISTPDMSVIAFWDNNPWNPESFAEGVVFDMTQDSGISAVSVAKAKGLTVGANGTVKVPAGFVSLKVYNLSGACVESVKNPAGTVTLNLGSGLYIAKGTRADGTVSVVKVSK